MSRDRDYSARSPEFDEVEREESSPTWPGVRDELFVMHDDDAKLQATWQVSGDISGSGTALPSRDSAAKSPSPPPRSPSVASRVATPSTRSASVQSRREKVARSRGSSAVSSDVSEQWKESIMAAGDAEQRKSSSSSREKIITSRSPDLQNDGQDEEIKVDGDIRTSSAKSAQEGTETKATLGSEADLAQVSEAIVRSQSVVEGVHAEMVAEEETVDQEWPGVVEDEEDAELHEINESNDEESITQGNVCKYYINFNLGHCRTFLQQFEPQISSTKHCLNSVSLSCFFLLSVNFSSSFKPFHVTAFKLKVSQCGRFNQPKRDNIFSFLPDLLSKICVS